MFLKQGKDEIPNCKPNLVEIFSRLEKISAQTQGMKKRNHEIFGGFPKSGDEISKIYFFQKKKKNLKNNLERIFIPDFGKPQNFMISFFHPLNLSGVVLGENLSRSSFSLLPKGLSGKSLFLNFICDEITPSKTFPSIYSQTFPNPIPDQSQSHQSLPLKTKIQFDQNFLPAKRSANHSMFFRRL